MNNLESKFFADSKFINVNTTDLMQVRAIPFLFVNLL